MHHLFTPSGSSRWLECTVSLAMEQALGLPFDGEEEEAGSSLSSSNQFAVEGTIAHAVGEWCLLGNKNATECTTLMLEDGTIHRTTAEMRDYVQVYVNHIRSLITPTTISYIEKRKVLDWIDPDLGGTADYVGITGDVLDVADLKYGQFHSVSAVENTQLMIYALAQIGKDNPYGIKKVRLHIIQPRIYDKPSVWETDIDYLRAFEKKVAKAIAIHRKRLDSGTLPTNLKEYTFGEHCKFCRALSVCRKVDSEFIKETKMATSVQLKKMDEQQLADRLVRAKVFAKYIKALEADAKARLEQGVRVDGFALETTLRREWADEWEARKIAANIGIDIMGVKSPSEVAKIVGNDVVSKHFGPVIAPKEVVKMVQA